MILVQDDISDISKQASKAILDYAARIKDKEHIVLALPGGRSVKGIYEELSKSKNPIWSKIHIFLIDERAVPITDAESNFRLIKESFADKLIKEGILSKSNLHPFIKSDTAQNIDTQRYTAELERYGGMFDIALVASGEDGHIAALFPGHKTLSAPGKKYIYINDSPKPPAERVTSSIELISGAGLLLTVFIGETKRKAYDSFNDEKISILDCPAKIARKTKNSIVYTDLRQKP